MTIKDWLNRGRHLDAEINSLLDAEAQALALACRVTSAPSDNKVQSSTGNSSEDAFIKYADYSRMIDERIDKLYDIKKDIIDLISKVDNPTYRVLLTERYINSKSWEEISDTMHFTLRQIHRIHGHALIFLKDVTKCH